MTKRHLTIATRESPLAKAQAELVKTLLIQQHPSLSIALLGITTEADKHLDLSLTEIGGKGLFVKELEEALYERRADIAVHSMKDVPMTLPEGLILPVILKRADPRDVFVSNQVASFLQLPSGASVGTSSLRRQNQLRVLRSDLDYRPLRGNIQTRLRRLDQGDFSAIILAAAGLQRSLAGTRIRQFFPTEQLVPAAGQGALGIECRAEDESTQKTIAPLNDLATYHCVMAERALCRQLNGGCRSPIAAYASIRHEVLSLQGALANLEGTQLLRATREGDPLQAERIGLRVAEELLQQGASSLWQT